MPDDEIATDGSGRIRHEPEVIDETTIRLYGVGPDCPGCGGPTHCVVADEDAEKPWWCKSCNVRLDDDGEYGPAASFPAGNEPGDRDQDTGNGRQGGDS